jgi:hypothetical protein
LSEPPPLEEEEGGLTRWLRRQRLLLSLQRNPHWRRNGYALAGKILRNAITPLILGGALLGALVAGLLAGGLLSTRPAAYDYLLGFLLLSTLALGGALYRAEQQAGTLDLLWLACGSEQRLLRLKLLGAMAAQFFLLLPATLLLAYFHESLPQLPHLLVHLMLTGFFALAGIAWLGTLLPQAWASAIAAAVIGGVIFFTGHGSTTLIYPFHNPWDPGLPERSLVLSRVVYTIIAVFLLGSTAKRLRKTLGAG